MYKLFLRFMDENVLKVFLKLSIILRWFINSKKHHIKLTYSKLPDNVWILAYIFQMKSNTVGCSWILHHVQNPTLTSARCFVLRRLDIITQRWYVSNWCQCALFFWVSNNKLWIPRHFHLNSLHPPKKAEVSHLHSVLPFTIHVQHMNY